MSTSSDLEAYASDLTTAVKTLATHCSNLTPTTSQPLIPPDAPNEAHRARQSILATISSLQALLTTPSDFLHHLTVQSQLLACLQWLGEFQVLACIPLTGNVPIKDVADLAGVPEGHLTRVIRMTATAGFLQEPQPGFVAHSALSAPFVTKPSYLDAVMFLASTATPAALQMPAATQRFGQSLRANETAFNLAFNTPVTFASTTEQRPRIQRQWPAFLRYGTKDVDDRVTDLLSRLDHFRRGSTTIVEVGARSLTRATTLTNLYPSLRIIVQIAPPSTSSNGWSSPIRPSSPCSKHDDLSPLAALTTNPNTNGSTTSIPRVTLQERAHATPQPISDASVYILHLPSPSPTTPFGTLAARIIAELRAHLDILRANPSTTLILTPRLLPDPGAVNPDIEATARLRDLSLLQLANEREIELAELLNIIGTVSDSLGSSIAYLIFYLCVSPIAAQDQSAQVWAAFAYTVRGESTPKAVHRPRALTAYGANQLHDAGSAFRGRYVALNAGLDGPSTRIENISPYLLNNEDVKASSTPDAAILASAQAFMQGLYPPLDESFNSTYFGHEMELANGSVTSGPLGGYQYPSIVTHGVEDPRSITIAAHALCPAHILAKIQYVGSNDFWQTYQDSSVFYNHLHSQALSGEFDTTEANYANATSISEFLEYQAVHNESLLHSLSREDIKRARWFAGKYVFATHGNTSSSGAVADGSIRTIAGQGLASSALDAFETNIQQRGVDGKITLQFGGYETAMSFFSLLQLGNPQYSRFSSLPNFGASAVLELFSVGSESYPTYPDPSQLYVQFLLRNGTGAQFVPYPLFGHGPSKTAIPFSEFQAEMQKLAIGTTADWCQRCNSSAVFCSGVVNAAKPTSRFHNDKGGMSNAVAGVIGAVVTIAVLALSALGFLAYKRRTKWQRRSSLGGFKGDSKMASDTDLAFKQPQLGSQELKPPATPARGYERHGSWELTDNASPSRLAERGTEPSFADDIEDEWRLHSTVRPARVHEHV
ncbi:histidine phosphatase superfamily [Aspergillus crustosus]